MLLPFCSRQAPGRRLASGFLPWLTAATLAAGAQAADTPVYRCGSSYSSTPCPAGNAVDASDARSAAQQKEALEAQRRDAKLADQLADERRARERAAAGQVAVGIGPTAANAPAAAASKPKGKAKNTGTKRPKTSKGASLDKAPRAASAP